MKRVIISDVVHAGCDFADEIIRDKLWCAVVVEDVDEKDEGVSLDFFQWCNLQVLHDSCRKFQIVEELVANDVW